jgi:hypothetical protein
MWETCVSAGSWSDELRISCEGLRANPTNATCISQQTKPGNCVKTEKLFVPRTARFPKEETVYQSECLCLWVREHALRKLIIRRTENKNTRRLSALLMVTAYKVSRIWPWHYVLTTHVRVIAGNFIKNYEPQFNLNNI